MLPYIFSYPIRVRLLPLLDVVDRLNDLDRLHESMIATNHHDINVTIPTN